MSLPSPSESDPAIKRLLPLSFALPPAIVIQGTATAGAIFDRSYQYRYGLWRQWDATQPQLVWIMLNPSQADDRVNDPTIRRCIQLAQQWQYGTIWVGNLFAYRTSNPRDLRQVSDPVGQLTDRLLQDASQIADRIVVAWGNGGRWQGRDRAVLSWLEPLAPLYCLDRTQSGSPRHPLYVRRDVKLQPFIPTEI